MERVTRNEQRFGLNAPAVACQVVDGEAIVIDFGRGHYFSAAHAGARILAVLADRPANATELASELAGCAGLEHSSAIGAARRFLRQLLDEGLVVALDESVDGDEAPEPQRSAPSVEEPQLVKYTDLQDLLVLDPIHEVMATGWPARAV
jgi:hypothetical protein